MKEVVVVPVHVLDLSWELDPAYFRDPFPDPRGFEQFLIPPNPRLVLTLRFAPQGNLDAEAVFRLLKTSWDKGIPVDLGLRVVDEAEPALTPSALPAPEK